MAPPLSRTSSAVLPSLGSLNDPIRQVKSSKILLTLDDRSLDTPGASSIVRHIQSYE